MRKTLAILSMAVLLAACSENGMQVAVSRYGVNCPIYPDYIDVTVPYTIAPLNFSYMMPERGKVVTTFSYGDISFSVKGRKVRIPEKRWHALLAAARGGDVTVYSSLLDTAWTIHVSADEIDYGLNYRLIEPSYEIYSKMGIYERNLSNFEQIPILENTEFFGCCNCHSHCKGDPATLSMHIRGPKGCTIIMKDGKMDTYYTKTDSTLSFCVYTYWHPSGNYIAYSSSKSNQGFHTGDRKVLEVIDKQTDIQVYDIRRNQLVTSHAVKTEEYGESFPSFSPDGRTLYFTRFNLGECAGDLRKIKYSLMKVSFDPETGNVGNDVTTLIDCNEIGQGVCFPKPSYDGKYIMYVRSDYGVFPSWHPESQLWLYNVETGEDRCLDEVNSDGPEGCHSWSSDNRWFVFGSRRDDGLFTRVYIAHFDPETGRCGKPFMLPQKDPEKYYNELFFSFNIPEFVTGPAVFDNVEAQRRIDENKLTEFGFRYSD